MLLGSGAHEAGYEWRDALPNACMQTLSHLTLREKSYSLNGTKVGMCGLRPVCIQCAFCIQFANRLYRYRWGAIGGVMGLSGC